MTKKIKRVAVFDIDGTIFRSSLLIELVDALIAQKLFPVSASSFYEKQHRYWLDRKGGYASYINGVVKAFDFYIKGVNQKQFLRAVQHIIAAHKNRTYRFTRDLVRDLRRRNYFLLAISHSPKFIVDEFATKLGFHRVYGRILEIDKRESFTGVILYEDLISDKAKILMRFVRKEGMSLHGSIGVGDTDSDVSFLKLVDRPICFNPNKKLYRIAKKNHWEVVVERKDMIYKI